MPRAGPSHGYRRFVIAHQEDAPCATSSCPTSVPPSASIGLFDSLVDRANETADGYPPYNIAKTGEDAYRITLAVAGFAADEIDIVVQENFLSVSAATQSEPVGTLLHRGIASRSFSRRLSARGPRSCRRRDAREWSPLDRSRERGSGGEEAAHGEDRVAHTGAFSESRVSDTASISRRHLEVCNMKPADT